MSNDLIPRTTVEQIVTMRNLTLAKYGDAYAALKSAENAVKVARVAGETASPGKNSYN